MNTLRARVVKGRLVLDEPCSLPEGTVLDLVVADEGDSLDEEERHALHAALTEAWESAKRGELRDADEVMRELRKRR